MSEIDHAVPTVPSADVRPLVTSPLIYGGAIFVSAFLIFQVQPLIGKYILPWFGSSAGIWTTALLFFQIALMCGYAYAHVSSTRLPRQWQVTVHLALLVLALVFLPIIPDMNVLAGVLGTPMHRVLLLLTVTIGLPYFLLASTSSLLQHWYAASHREGSPYRLYALSNAGSLIGLVSYPFLIEPFMRMKLQAWLWSWGFVFFACLCAFLAWGYLRHGRELSADTFNPSLTPPRPSFRTCALWVLLAGLPSALLVASTSRMSVDIPAVPFLFVVALGTYLTTFIIAFDAEHWYRPFIFTPLMLLASGMACYAVHDGAALSMLLRLITFAAALFFCALCCHGELARRKPPPEWLTAFFLLVTAGGALGGLLAAWLAPQVFPDYWEYEISLLGSSGFILWLVIRQSCAKWIKRADNARYRVVAELCVLLPSILVTGLFGAYIYYQQLEDSQKVLERRRSFYGTLKVMEELPADGHSGWLTLMNGRIDHGLQRLDPTRANWTTSYYGAGSGAGRAILGHPNHGRTDSQFRLGVIGLGVGTLAVFTNDRNKFVSEGTPVADYLVFYEINPQVLEIADSRFTFLERARNRGVEVTVELGDARVVLERQLAEGQRQHFDVLAVDAFTSDAIPTHLLTREGFELYLQHLNDDGIIAFHISNHYLDLAPVVWGLAEHFGMAFRLVSDAGDDFGHSSSDWALVTNNEEFLESVSLPFTKTGEDMENKLLWTDDFSSLLTIIRPTVFSMPTETDGLNVNTEE